MERLHGPQVLVTLCEPLQARLQRILLSEQRGIALRKRTRLLQEPLTCGHFAQQTVYLALKGSGLEQLATGALDALDHLADRWARSAHSGREDAGAYLFPRQSLEIAELVETEREHRPEGLGVHSPDKLLEFGVTQLGHCVAHRSKGDTGRPSDLTVNGDIAGGSLDEDATSMTPSGQRWIGRAPSLRRTGKAEKDSPQERRGECSCRLRSDRRGRRAPAEGLGSRVR